MGGVCWLRVEFQLEPVILICVCSGPFQCVIHDLFIEVEPCGIPCRPNLCRKISIAMRYPVGREVVRFYLQVAIFRSYEIRVKCISLTINDDSRVLIVGPVIRYRVMQPGHVVRRDKLQFVVRQKLHRAEIFRRIIYMI